MTEYLYIEWYPSGFDAPPRSGLQGKEGVQEVLDTLAAGGWRLHTFLTPWHLHTPTYRWALIFEKP